MFKHANVTLRIPKRGDTMMLLCVVYVLSHFLTFVAAMSDQDFPPAVTADTGKIVFHTASDLPALLDRVRKEDARIIKLRAFAADSGAAAVEQVVRETFAKHGQALPAFTLVQVGALPDSAEVLWESIIELQQTANPHGLAFISGQPASAQDATAPLAPLAERSLDTLRSCLRAVNLDSASVVRVTCLMSSLADLDAVKRSMAGEFSQSTFSYVQLQKQPSRAVIECEAVARLHSAPGRPFLMVQPDDLNKSPNYSHVALVGTPSLVFSSSHVAKGLEEVDARAMFEQLKGTLDRANASIRRVAMSNLYPTSPAASNLIRNTRFEFYDREHPPASTMMLYEALPDGAVFAVDVVAVPGEP